MSPLGPKLRWSRGQQPDGQRLEGDFEEEDKLGGFEILGDGESSNQTVPWILFSCFELYVCGTAGSVLSSVASVVALLQTLAAWGIQGCDNNGIKHAFM